MSKKWYYQKLGTELGPFAEAHLIDLIRRGNINPEDLVRREDGKWLAVFEVDGMLDAAAKPIEFLKVDNPEDVIEEDEKEPVEEPIIRRDPEHDWYCIATGDKLGPLSFEELKELAKEGRLRSRDRVWRTRQPKFLRAADIQGLVGGSSSL